jgi:hypothetical protein
MTLTLYLLAVFEPQYLEIERHLLFLEKDMGIAQNRQRETLPEYG